MLFFLISIFYAISCDAVANIGADRKIGRGKAFIFSFALTPILGYAITSLSKELDDDDIACKMVYDEMNEGIFSVSLTRTISILVAINAVMFGFEVWLAINGVISIMDPLSLHMGSEFRIWQLLTHQFLHGGVSHLYGNMIILLIAGPSVEKIYGTKNTLFGYILFGIAAGILQMAMNDEGDKTAGASGAIFGIVALFALADNSRHFRLRWFKIKYLAIFLIAFELFNLNNIGDGIGHWAHFGGMIAGFVFYLTQKRDGTEA